MKIDRFIKGMDVSTIIEEEACGARFFKDGKEAISGMNSSHKL